MIETIFWVEKLFTDKLKKNNVRTCYGKTDTLFVKFKIKNQSSYREKKKMNHYYSQVDI